jgi:hypothetical protein
MPLPTIQTNAFSAYLQFSQAIPNATLTALAPYTQRFEDGGDSFDPVTGIFTVPVDGIYHFDAIITWAPPTVNANSYVRLMINGFECIGLWWIVDLNWRPRQQHNYIFRL